MILVLVGMMGSGKTTVAAIIGERAGCRVVDIDAEIEANLGVSIARIFSEQGEASFRSLEEAKLAEVLTGARDGVDLVVSTGGGAVVSAANRALLRSLPGGASGGRVVWLEAPVDELIERTVGGGRPMLDGGDGGARRSTLQAIFDSRAHWYAECSTDTVQTGGRSAAEVAEAVMAVTGLGHRSEAAGA